MKSPKGFLRVALDPLIVASASTGIMIIVLVTWGNKVHLNSSEWAGWVQAVGSISAILITLGLTNYQIKQQQQGENERALEETRRICLAIRDELRILQKIIATSSNVAALLRLQPGEIFDIAVPTVVPNERFSIYRAVLGRLTLIEDDQLRQTSSGPMKQRSAKSMLGCKITGCFSNCENSTRNTRPIVTNSSLISSGRLLPTCSSFANKPLNGLTHFFQPSIEQPGAVKTPEAAEESWAKDARLLSY
jgi:hypothetical protein